MEFNIITTERLKLRKITPEVFQFVFSNYEDSEIMKFFGYSEESLQVWKDRLDKGLTMFNKTLLYFHILDKDADALIGWCGYHTWYENHRRAEIGYEIYDESYKGKGIMTEAMHPILDYGFNEMNLHRIEALVEPNNVGSLKIMDNFGFIQEGHLKEHYIKDGTIEDSLVFALFRKNK